jgi:beta-lactamase regulating signal transducer with metallopeptidase domain/tetratricopeptide (TPR) repeat protein
MEDFVVTGVRFALDIAFKATVLLALTALAVSALSRRSAAVRQLVATLGLAGALLLPVASLVAPQWEIPLVPSPLSSVVPELSIAAETPEAPVAHWKEEETLSRASAESPRVRGESSRPPLDASARGEAASTTAAAARDDAPSNSKPLIDPVTAMLGILLLWSAGTVFALARLAVGLARVAGIRRRARVEADGPWADLLGLLSEEIAIERPVRLFFSDEIAVPVTAGVLRPVVLLPESARRWNDERRRVVLLHELAHVGRADWISLLLAQAAAAFYWFHPLAWSTRSQMRKDCERACDDLVLSAGTRPSVYAAHLLSIVRSLRLSKQRALPAVAMAHRSYWDGRMRAILDPRVERRRVSGGQARLAAVAVAGLVALLATVAPWTPRAAEAVVADDSAFSGDHSLQNEGADAKGQRRSRCESKTGAEKAVIEEQRPADPARVIEPALFEEPVEPASQDRYVQAGRKERKHGGSAYGRGMELHNDGQYDEAIAAFQQSIGDGEKVEAATYNIACGYALKGDRDRAFEWLEKAMDAGFELEKYIDRDDDLDGLRSDPRFAALRKAARAKKIEDSRDEAVRYVERYERLKAANPRKGSGFYDVAMELHEVGRHDLAAQAWEASAARGHKTATSLYNVACALSMKGEGRRALEFLHRALLEGFDDPGQIRKDADLDNVRGEPRYRELLKMAEDLELHRFDGDFGWGRKALRSTRERAWREVESHFEEYARLHPEIGRAWFNLGYARIEGDRAAEAAPAFRRALDLGYRKPTTLYNLACAYSLLDRKDEAFTYLFQALDAGFDGNGNLRGDDDLDNLRGDPRFRQALARLKDRGNTDYENWSD